ncbi:MAG: oligoribonuclease [Rhodoglobus sp.]
MSETTPKIAHGDEYIVFYVDGPYDGTNDRRIATEAAWDDYVTLMVADAEGSETQLRYDRPVAKQVGDQVHVTYTWDQPASEPLEDLNERNDG